MGTSSRRAPWRTVLRALLPLVLTGCVLQPAYESPRPAVNGQWQAELPHGGSATQLIDWWQGFNDPTIAELIRAAEADSPTLAQAAAAIRAARAALASSKADAWPTLGASGSVTRAKSSALPGSVNANVGSANPNVDAIGTTRSGGLDASWELDLFGRQRSSRESARAQVEASIDDWHDARVTLAAEVADDYVQYRACRSLQEAYEAQARSQQQTAQSTRGAVAAGLSARADVYLAEASAANAAATAVTQRTSCENLVKSLVEVTGLDEARLRATIDRKDVPALPEPAQFTVGSVPADLVRQRPDLASSERALASYYARVGVARADRYPNFSLSGSISVSASELVSTTTGWSFGPSLSLPLFDGGKRRAAVESAVAAYEQQLASYRGAVRAAVREAEQALVDLDGAAQRSEDARVAAEQYRLYAAAAESNWRAGFDSLLTLEEARRAAISAEVSLLGLQRDRVRSWIALYKALGGGWRDDLSTQATPVAQTGANQNADTDASSVSSMNLFFRSPGTGREDARFEFDSEGMDS